MYSDPLELFRTAVDLLNSEDWRGVAALCDPASLDEFKSALLANLSPSTDQLLKLTTTELMKAVPSMPRAVAEYQLARFRENLDPQRLLRDEVPSVTSLATLQAMSAKDSFAAWLEGKSLRRQVERNVERKRMSRATANEVIAEGLRRHAFTPIGFVAESEDAGYVVYHREPGSQRPATEMVRRIDGGWLLVADRYFLMMHRVQLVATPDSDLD